MKTGKELEGVLKPTHIRIQNTYDRNGTKAFVKYDLPLIIVLEVDQVDIHVVSFVDELRSLNYDRPIIILSPSVRAFKNRPNIHVIDRSEIHEKLFGLVKKLLSRPNSPNQRHKRFVTHQNLDIECLEDGTRFESCMENLSAGGAMCSFKADPKLQKGNLLRLKVRLDEVNKSHNMHAEVVWLEKNQSTGAVACGVRFVNEQTIYSQLMARI